MDSGGFHRTPDIPLESRCATGFHWFLPESGNSAGFHWCWVDLLSGKSLDGFHGLRWNMLVSSGLRRTPPGINMPIWLLSHQDIPGFESGITHLLLPHFYFFQILLFLLLLLVLLSFSLHIYFCCPFTPFKYYFSFSFYL